MAQPPATDRQKAQVLDLLRQGRSSREIAEAVSLARGQVSAIKAHLTGGTFGGGAAEKQEQEILDAIETTSAAYEATFGLERDLQRALRANIHQIEPGLKIIDGGKEQTVASGRIDILAKDPQGAAVVIELKVGAAHRDAIGQILSYMGDLGETVAKTRGIVVAGDFAPPAISAARAVSTIRLLKYTFNFSFEAVCP